MSMSEEVHTVLHPLKRTHEFVAHTMFTAADIDPTATNSPKFRLIAVQCVRPLGPLSPVKHLFKRELLPPNPIPRTTQPPPHPASSRFAALAPSHPVGKKKDGFRQSGCYSRTRRQLARSLLGDIASRELLAKSTLDNWVRKQVTRSISNSGAADRWCTIALGLLSTMFVCFSFFAESPRKENESNRIFNRSPRTESRAGSLYAKLT